jgi:hypothetical protein
MGDWARDHGTLKFYLNSKIILEGKYEEERHIFKILMSKNKKILNIEKCKIKLGFSDFIKNKT